MIKLNTYIPEADTEGKHNNKVGADIPEEEDNRILGKRMVAACSDNTAEAGCWFAGFSLHTGDKTFYVYNFIFKEETNEDTEDMKFLWKADFKDIPVQKN